MTNPHAEQDALEAAEHAAILRADYSHLSGDEAWQAQEAKREAARLKRQAEYEALPAIKRIETWHETACSWPMGTAFRLLGDALRDWAKEQQK